MKKAFFYMTMSCMVLELTYINSRSLLFLVEDYDWVGKIFAVIGAMTYSMVTMLVMRTSYQRPLKFIFPGFDVLLVFCGLNLRFANDLTANPVALGLTILIALFTGLITFSLGTIDINRAPSNKEADLDRHKSKMLSNQIELKRLQSELIVNQRENSTLNSNVIDLETQVKKYKTDMDNLKSQLKKSESEMLTYRKSHFQSERSRILKKKVTNRTDEEVRLLQASELNISII